MINSPNQKNKMNLQSWTKELKFEESVTERTELRKQKSDK